MFDIEQIRQLEGLTIAGSVLLLIALLLAGYAIRGMFGITKGNQDYRRQKLDAEKIKLAADQEERAALHRQNDEMLALYRDNLDAMKKAHELSAQRLALEEKREEQRIENERTVIELTKDNITAIKENTATLKNQNETLEKFVETVTESIEKLEAIMLDFISKAEERDQQLVDKLLSALLKELKPSMEAMVATRESITNIVTPEQLAQFIRLLEAIEKNVLKIIERYDKHEKVTDVPVVAVGVVAADVRADAGTGATGDGSSAVADD
jgi:hypothetical protein